MKWAGILIAFFVASSVGCGTNKQQEANLGISLPKKPSAEAYQLRAEAELDPSRFLRAIENAEAGLKLDPNNRELREIHDLASVHLKLANHAVRVVDNSRYKAERESSQANPAGLEQISFGDATQQREKLRGLVEQNPFWKKSTGAERESHLQDLLELDEEFLPLAISNERIQLAKDQAAEREIRDQRDLNIIVAFGFFRPFDGMILELGEAKPDGRLLLSTTQRSAITKDYMEAGVSLQQMTEVALMPAFPLCPWNLAHELYDRATLGGLRRSCQNVGAQEDWRLLTQSESLARRLSMDRLLGVLWHQCSPHEWRPPRGEVFISGPNLGVIVTR
jgi:hypothetical protein